MEIDNYNKVFDSNTLKATLVNGELSIAGRKFRKKDILLGLITLVSLTLVIALVIVVVHKATREGVTEKATPYCNTVPCLQAAAYAKGIMDETLDPCDDFYKYTCANYAKAHPKILHGQEMTPFEEIIIENENKLHLLLDDFVRGSHEHEHKLKDFMISCQNHFFKIELGGKPFVEQIINEVGGWSVLGTFDRNNFDLNKMLQKTQIKFWTLSLFTHYDHHLEPKGTVLPPEQYQSESHSKQNTSTMKKWNAYKNYMTAVAKKLAEQTSVGNFSHTPVTTFVEDVCEIEKTLANIILTTKYQLNVTQLLEMNKLSQNMIDFVAFFQTLYSDVTNKPGNNTRFIVVHLEYFKSLGIYLGKLMNSHDGKRKLHNYFVWHLINKYIQNLDINYKYLWLKFKLETHDSIYIAMGDHYCFKMVKKQMREALNALYVTKHIQPEEKAEGTRMVNLIKDQLVKELRENFSWLSEPGKNMTIQRVQDGLYKVGYNEVYENLSKVDDIYKNVKINRNDFFGNFLSLNQILKDNMNKLWMYKQDQDFATKDLDYDSFYPIVKYYRHRNELIVTEAVLQKHLFNFEGPFSMNMGSVGALIGTNLIHAVHGLRHLESYNDIQDCTKTFLDDKPLPEHNKDCPHYMCNANDVPSLILKELYGIKLALKAFRANKNSTNSKLPPGFEHFNDDKMFFISYAQSQCSTLPGNSPTRHTYKPHLPRKYLVNTALANLQEFQDAFQCSSSKKIVSQQRCTLF